MRYTSVRQRLTNWYDGEAYDINDSSSDVIILPGLEYRRHWTARVTRAVFEFHQREWKWAVPVYLAALSAIVGIVALT